MENALYKFTIIIIIITDQSINLQIMWLAVDSSDDLWYVAFNL